ncbi:MAG: sigma-70 family RNA polymerase sigma factor [Prevotellaceae bacterium]|nr:sigma-70 family RNA polymerase sigma factor [Prevotellaceae bacterium]
MSKETEQKIVELERIVAERQDWLFRFAYMRIGRREDAEDLVQEVFLKLFKAMNKSGEVDDIERYLIRSISNACHDYFRRKRQTMIPIDETLQITVDESDKQIHEEFMRINKMLDDIPPEQAETLRLKCYDGLTFKQIGELQDIPEATVKSRYRYAITTLSKRVNSKG